MDKTYIITKEQYQIVKATWATKTHAAVWHILYNILRSKPADLGFSIKTKNIQGNDPWYGYNEPLRAANRLVDYTNPWEASINGRSNSSYDHGVKMIEKRKQEFFDCFGIEMPGDMKELLGGKKQ